MTFSSDILKKIRIEPCFYPQVQKLLSNQEIIYPDGLHESKVIIFDALLILRFFFHIKLENEQIIHTKEKKYVYKTTSTFGSFMDTFCNYIFKDFKNNQYLDLMILCFDFINNYEREDLSLSMNKSTNEKYRYENKERLDDFILIEPITEKSFSDENLIPIKLETIYLEKKLRYYFYLYMSDFIIRNLYKYCGNLENRKVIIDGLPLKNGLNQQENHILIPYTIEYFNNNDSINVSLLDQKYICPYDESDIRIIHWVNILNEPVIIASNDGDLISIASFHLQKEIPFTNKSIYVCKIENIFSTSTSDLIKENNLLDVEDNEIYENILLKIPRLKSSSQYYCDINHLKYCLWEKFKMNINVFFLISFMCGNDYNRSLPSKGAGRIWASYPSNKHLYDNLISMKKIDHDKHEFKFILDFEKYKEIIFNLYNDNPKIKYNNMNYHLLIEKEKSKNSKLTSKEYISFNPGSLESAAANLVWCFCYMYNAPFCIKIPHPHQKDRNGFSLYGWCNYPLNKYLSVYCDNVKTKKFYCCPEDP